MEFECIAIDKKGKQVRSLLKAESEAAVAHTLRETGFIPLKITRQKQKETNVLGSIFSPRKVVSLKEKVIFTRQLGAVLSAGVLLSDGIETIATDMENQYFADILKSVVFYIHSGENFSSALGHYPSIFSPYYIAIVSSGETIGNLGGTVTSLANFMEEDEKTRLKFLAAIRYPVFLMSFVFCIVSGIVLFLIPKFKSIFEGAGTHLPLLTQIVVDISEFSLHYFFFVIMAIVAITFAGWHALRNFQLRFMIDYALLQIPVIGKVIRKALVSQFCQTLSMLLEGGVGIITALTLSSKVINNSYLNQVIAEIRREVMEGSSLSQSMATHGDIPRILVKMVAVGEKAGKLDEMLKRVGVYYDQEVDLFLNNINSLLEPIFIIIIGAVVLVVALALYLPIFEMSSTMH